jgi:hypothetical protein
MPPGGLRWYQIINLRVQIDKRLVSNVTGAMLSDRRTPSPAWRESTSQQWSLSPRHSLRCKGDI